MNRMVFSSQVLHVVANLQIKSTRVFQPGLCLVTVSAKGITKAGDLDRLAVAWGLPERGSVDPVRSLVTCVLRWPCNALRSAKRIQ